MLQETSISCDARGGVVSAAAAATAAAAEIGVHGSRPSYTPTPYHNQHVMIV